MKTKKIMLGYLLFSIAAGLGLAVWRTVLLYRHFDPYAESFPNAASDSLETFGYVMLFCILASVTVMLFLHRKESNAFWTSANDLSIFAGSLLGCIFIAAGTLALIYYTKEMFPENGNPIYRFLIIAALISLYLSAIYFFLSVSSAYTNTKLRKILSFFPAVFSVCYLCAAYLSPDFVFSDHNDILRNTSIASFAFFFIYEAKTSVYGKTDAFRFMYILIMLICVLTYTIPMLIVTAFWETDVTYMTMFDLVGCIIPIYAVTVAIAMISSVKERKIPQKKKKQS